MGIHHLMIGTWTPPGAIFTVAFDDEKKTLELVKRTPIPEDEPISWMTFDVCDTKLDRRSTLTTRSTSARISMAHR
jgi:hypothetical protein